MFTQMHFPPSLTACAHILQDLVVARDLLIRQIPSSVLSKNILQLQSKELLILELRDPWVGWLSLQSEVNESTSLPICTEPK